MSQSVQVRLLREFPAVATRMFPLVVNPLPPPFGLVLLAFANSMPRTLLSHHYYSETQQDAFAQADSWAAHRRYRKLVAALASKSSLLSSGSEVCVSENDNAVAARDALEALNLASTALGSLANAAALSSSSAVRGVDGPTSSDVARAVRRRRLAHAIVGAFLEATSEPGPLSSPFKGAPPLAGAAADGPLALGALSPAHARRLLKATAASVRGTGLPGAPGYAAWVLARAGTATATRKQQPAPSGGHPPVSRAPAWDERVAGGLAVADPDGRDDGGGGSGVGGDKDAGGAREAPAMPGPAAAAVDGGGGGLGGLTADRRLLYAYAAALADDDRRLIGLVDSLGQDSGTSAGILGGGGDCGDGGGGADVPGGSRSEGGSLASSKAGAAGGPASLLAAMPPARLRTACLERGLLFRGTHLGDNAPPAASSDPASGGALGKRSTPPLHCYLGGDAEEMAHRLWKYLAAVRLLRRASATGELPPSLVLHLPLLLSCD